MLAWLKHVCLNRQNSCDDSNPMQYDQSCHKFDKKVLKIEIDLETKMKENQNHSYAKIVVEIQETEEYHLHC